MGCCSPDKRCVVVSWLVEVASLYGLRQTTLFLAVNYLDRFLGSAQVRGGSGLRGAGWGVARDPPPVGVAGACGSLWVGRALGWAALHRPGRSATCCMATA